MEAVADVLSAAGDLPQRVRTMLVDHLPESLGVAADARHPFQEQLVGMVREVLEGAQQCHQTLVEAAKTRAAEVAGRMRQGQAAADAAAVECAGRAAAFDEARTVLEAAGEAVQVARATSAQAAESCREVEAGAAVAAERLQRLAVAQRETLPGLRDGLLPALEVPAASAAVLALARELNLEASLLGSLPGVFGRPPVERGSFDGLVLSSLEVSLKEHATILAEAAAARASASVAASAEALEREAAVRSAVATEAERRGELRAAQAAQRAAEVAYKAASKALQPLVRETKEVEAALASVRSALERFEQGPLAAFRELAGPAPAVTAGAAGSTPVGAGK